MPHRRERVQCVASEVKVGERSERGEVWQCPQPVACQVGGVEGGAGLGVRGQGWG